MLFEEMVQNLVRRENKDAFKLYEDEDVVLTLKNNDVIEGYVTKYYPFYSDITEKNIELDLGDEEDSQDDDHIGELHLRLSDGSGDRIIRRKNVSVIRRKVPVKSLFNQKQRALLKGLGIDESSFTSKDEYHRLLDEIAVKYHELYANRQYADAEQVKDMMFRFKGIEPAWVSLEDTWRAYPLDPQEYLNLEESDFSYWIFNIPAEEVPDLKLPSEFKMETVAERVQMFLDHGLEKYARDERFKIDQPLLNWKGEREPGDAYLNLHEVFEADIYSKEFTSGKKIVNMKPDYSEYLVHEAWRRAACDELPSAEEYIRAARKFNPVSAHIQLDYAEILRIWGKNDRAYLESVKALNHAFRPGDRARCFRNMGDYYSNKSKYREAVICYAFSLWFGITKETQSRVRSVLRHAPDAAAPVSWEEAHEFAVEHNFDILPGVAETWKLDSIANTFIKQGRPDVAEYYLEIAYGLTHDIKIQGKLRYLRGER